MPKATRRRGQALVDDILTATYDLLQTVAYEDLSMEMIAKNAHTNKSVLYRRWDSKSAIVMAALQSQIDIGAFKLTPPDTGSLRGDLIALFDAIMDRLQQLHYQNMMGLIAERAGAISMTDYFQKLARKNYLTLIISEFFAHAKKRGELSATPPAYLLDLPFLLTLDMLFGESHTITRDELHALVDQALMPVYQQFLK